MPVKLIPSKTMNLAERDHHQSTHTVINTNKEMKLFDESTKTHIKDLQSINTVINRKEMKLFDESTKTHLNTLHSRNASLPSLNTPNYRDLTSKNKENEAKKTFIYSPREGIPLPKGSYFNTLMEEKTKVNPGMRKLRETLDLNCYARSSKKKG